MKQWAIIGRAVAIAIEGAEVAILYNENDSDPTSTRELVEAKEAGVALC